MNSKPINLSVTDLLETRESRYHGRWPRDPDTTQRLKGVIEGVPRRRYKVNPELLIKALILLSLGVLGVKALTYFL